MSTQNRIIASLIAGAVALAPALPVLAAFHEQLRERRQERREAVQERRGATTTREGVRERVEERRQVATKRLAERRRQNIRAFFNRMVKRVEAALERQRKLAERIQSRIAKARANNRDVTQAQAAVDRAQAQWQDAKNALEGVKGRLEGVLAAEDPKVAFQEVRALVAQVRDQVKAVHAALVDATTALKGVGGGARQGQAATTTP